jgi:WD40 repeat protein
MQGKLLAEMLHDEPIAVAAFNTKGDRIVTTSVNGKVFLWDLAGKQPVQMKNAAHSPLKYVKSAEFNSAGDRILTVRLDFAAICDLAGNEIVHMRLDQDNDVDTAKFNGTGDRILKLHDGKSKKIALYDLMGNELAQIKCDNPFTSFALNFAGDQIVTTAIGDKVARVWGAKLQDNFSPDQTALLWLLADTKSEERDFDIIAKKYNVDAALLRDALNSFDPVLREHLKLCYKIKNFSRTTLARPSLIGFSGLLATMKK